MLKKLVVLMVVVAFSTTAMAAKKASKQLTGTVNINTATAQELVLLPGIGKAKADAVISYRQANPFKSAQDITKVKGIGKKMFELIQQYVTVDGPTTAKAVKAAAQPSRDTSQSQTAAVQKSGS